MHVERTVGGNNSVGAGAGGRVHKTLDLEHNTVLYRLDAQRSKLKLLREQRTAVDATINEVEAIERRSRSDDDFNRLTHAYETRDRLNTDIDELESRSDEVGYYMRTADILFKYYDIIEKGTSAPLTSSTSATATPHVASNGNSCSILKYFNSPSATPPVATLPNAYNATLDTATTATKAKSIPRSGTNKQRNPDVNDRATLLDRYLQSVHDDGPTRHITNPVAANGSHTGHGKTAHHAHTTDTCQHCGQGDLTVMLQEGYVFCKACHTVEYILVDHEKPSYKDPPKEIAYFAYKRINHLNEWLNQVQGKETTEIPDDVFDSIMVEIKKQKLTNIAQLTRTKVKDILKKLRINKYYEHVPHIINRLNGMPSPHMPPELEDRLRHMFCMIQVPFLKFSPSSRKNFLSYSYCLHKMMQLLEKDQYLDSFPLLKSREKLHQQDQIWQKICADIGWDFIPSL